MVGDSNDDINFPRKILLTNTHVSRLRKAFVNKSSGNIKIPKTRLNQIGQSRGFLGRIRGSLLKTNFPLMKNVLKSLAKSALIPLRLTTTASVTYAAIEKSWTVMHPLYLTLIVLLSKALIISYKKWMASRK